MISVATFRADYGEFASVSLYPASAVQYWINVAGMLLRSQRWGAGSAAPVAPAAAMLDVASELFVAHNLALEKQAGDAARRGGTPGTTIGPITSKSVGGVSASYDAASAQEEGAGHWNSTTYGTRLYRLMALFGAGPVQVGACGDEWGAWQPGVTPSAYLPPVGTITFTLNPAPGSSITLGETAVVFVAAAPAGDEVLIGATLGATMVALLQFLDTSADASISACNYALTAPSPPAFVLDVAYKELGPSGNTFAIATSAAGSTASGPTLQGPILTNQNGFGVDPWLGPPPFPGQTMFG